LRLSGVRRPAYRYSLEPVMSSDGTWIDHFPGNFMWSNATLVCKGMAPYGAVAPGEIDRICARLNAREGEPDAWSEEWCAMAGRLETIADEAAAEGRHHTAGNYYLRAGNYYYTGERFVPPGERKLAVYRKALRCYRAGLQRRHPNIEFVEVPYEGSVRDRGTGGSPAPPSAATLPAYFMKAPRAAGRAPTVVLFDGMDNCKEMSVLFAGLEFASRGIHTLAIDGPGQGEALRLRKLYARHDYEVSGTAAYEYVAGRADVDAQKVTIMGYSFGGYYAPRAAAFEPRYAACVCLGALHWDVHAWQAQMRGRAQSAPKEIAQSNFQFQWILGVNDADTAIERARQFSLKDVAAKITCPVLITHGINDRMVPVEAAYELYAALATPRKTLKIFTPDEGGAEHCQVDNRQAGIDYIADWIGSNIQSG
jgi:alpha-beta hydrolase superfamily lysophospholipase